MRRAIWALIGSLFFCLWQNERCEGQELGGEFHRLEGRHIVLITDLPPSNDVQQLPQAFDAAIEAWVPLFHQKPEEVANWRVQAFLMTDRRRFEQAGLMSANVREFREGHQENDLIFCKEQPSSYYRQHLLLHEGMHWFMWKSTGGLGPAWWMEGVAEWQSTHSWDGSSFVGGVIPSSRESFPYWGRIRWITQDLDAGEAPSIRIILSQARDLHRIDSTYAWSWAWTMFLANHPRYRDKFYELFTQPNDFSDAMNEQVLAWFGDDIGLLQAEFDGFVTALDYGVDPAKIVVDLKSPQVEQVDSLQLSPQDGWTVVATTELPKDLTIDATGTVDLESNPVRIYAEPEGVTLRYVNGFPWGQLVGTVVDVQETQSNTARWKCQSIGRNQKLHLNANQVLLLRVNVAWPQADSASGIYHVTLAP